MVEALPESLKPLYFVEREIIYEENCCYCYIILAMVPAYKYSWIFIKYVKLFLLCEVVIFDKEMEMLE